MTRIQEVTLDALSIYMPDGMLSRISAVGTTLALHAETEGIHSGAVWATTDEDRLVGVIRHMKVPEIFRNLGIGNQLLRETEARLEKAGCRDCFVELTDKEGENRGAFFLNRGYSIDQTIYHHFTFRLSEARNTSWIYQMEQPPGYRLVEWNELPQFATLDSLADPEFSKGLMYGDTVVAWLSIQKIATNMLLFRTLHVEEGHRNLGQGIALFCEIVRRHQLDEHYDYMRIAVAGLNKSMLRFLQKRSRHGLIHHTSRVLLRKPL